MRGTLFGTATIAALALGLQPTAAQQTVKIGFVSTFSGSQAAIGEDMRRSVDLAVEHLGGSIGGKKIEIVYEDDQFKPDVGKARSEKLVQQDKVNFVAGYIWSNVLLVADRGRALQQELLLHLVAERPDADGDGRVPQQQGREEPLRRGSELRCRQGHACWREAHL